MAAQLIYYNRPNTIEPKLSNYQIFEVPDHDVESLKRVLSLAVGVVGVVRKVRKVYLIGQTRVHLDQVESLGSFMELEVCTFSWINQQCL